MQHSRRNQGLGTMADGSNRFVTGEKMAGNGIRLRVLANGRGRPAAWQDQYGILLRVNIGEAFLLHEPRSRAFRG